MKMTTTSKHTEAELRNIYAKRDPLTDFDNSYEFYAKLMFLPDLENNPEYDKNFSTTNLRSLFKEPEEARKIIECLNLLQKYSERVLTKKLVGYNEEVSVVNGKKTIERIPVYEKVEVRIPRYYKAHNYFIDKLRALIMTSKVRDGFTVREFNKRKIETSESIEDKTEPKSQFFKFGK